MPLHLRLIFAALVSGALLGPARVAGQELPPSSCEGDPGCRRSDFWVGEWEVRSPDGQVVGTNRIEDLLRGCLLVEHWASARGGEGKSINYYDAIRKRWVQTWEGQGGSIAVEGTLEDDAMRFGGEHRHPDGRREAYRMSFTPQADGTVRQFIEQSDDGGAT